MPRQAITVEHLLNEWKMRQAAYAIQIAKMDPNPQTGEELARLTVIIGMHNQLTRDIEQLEAVLSKEYPKIDLLEIILNGIRNDESKA